MSVYARIYRLSALVGATASLAACASNSPKTLPPDPSPTIVTSSSEATDTIVPGSQADFVQSMHGRDTIYFDTDRYQIDSNDVVALQAQAQWLQRYPQKRAILEGHADERGTRDYNLALGQKRANSAKNYLSSIGIDPARMTVVSYGKERPVAAGSDESSWARNRRAVTVTID